TQPYWPHGAVLWMKVPTHLDTATPPPAQQLPPRENEMLRLFRELRQDRQDLMLRIARELAD
ncbi:MAG TPA: hypothetical protein PLC24_12105, partial [Myxococcota bacterium]|nr:hypothetical protein [Myxococcota bacterium]